MTAKTNVIWNKSETTENLLEKLASLLIRISLSYIKLLILLIMERLMIIMHWKLRTLMSFITLLNSVFQMNKRNSLCCKTNNKDLNHQWLLPNKGRLHISKHMTKKKVYLWNLSELILKILKDKERK